jgi:hypothetical protein
VELERAGMETGPCCRAAPTARQGDGERQDQRGEEDEDESGHG